MADRSQGAGGEDGDWIFQADPGTFATEQLPDREDFDRLVAERAAQQEAQRAAQDAAAEAAAAAPAGRPTRPVRAGRPVGAGARAVLDQRREQAQGSSRAPEAAPAPGPASPGQTAPDASDPAAAGDAEDRTWRARENGDVGPGQGGQSERAVQPAASYSRSGTTPNAEAAPRSSPLPARFADLGTFDAIRDVIAAVTLIAALSTTLTAQRIGWIDGSGRAAVGISLLTLLAVHLLRWIPAQPPLALIRRVRMIGQVPTLLVAAVAVLTDLVLSLPNLFASLPDGPPVGIGAGISLMIAGALVGIEPRAHEGYVPGARARVLATRCLQGIGIAAAVALVLAVVMLVGRIFSTGWAYSLLNLGSAMISALLLGIVISAALRRDRSWFVFSAAAASGLVLLAIADNSLGLQFAAPASFSTDFVYLPFLFAAWAAMVSRSFVRTMPLTFQRGDWIVYAVRAFEFSAAMHMAAVLWQALAAIASAGGVGRGGPVLHIVDALVCACFVVLSLFARRALLERPADIARASAVIASIVMLVIGFLDVVVNSLATNAGAGLVTGGVALAIGVAAALMLTVPAPVRDEFGAPDLVLMFEDFRSRNARARTVVELPDVAAERARKKGFPEA